MDILESYKNRLEVLNGKKADNLSLDRQISSNVNRMNELVKQSEIIQKASVLLLEIAGAKRGEIKDRIEGVMTQALRLVYDDEYFAELQYSTKHNRSWVEIVACKNTPIGVVRRLLGGFGGGVGDTISVPLRFMILSVLDTDKVCLLDESYKHVDTVRIEHVAQFLSQITKQLGIQIVLPTHHGLMSDYADKSWVFTDEKGKTTVREI